MRSLIENIWTFLNSHWDSAATGAISIFFGAVVGALVGLYFERSKAKKAEQKCRRGDLLEAQMILMCHINSLLDEKRKIEPIRKMPDRERMMPEIVHTFDQVSIDIRKLSFLLDGSDPNLVMDVYLAEQCYRNTCNAFNVRNEKLKAFQAGIEIQHFDLNTGASGGVGNLPDLKLLRDATDAVFDCLDDALDRHLIAMKKLKDHAKKLFPKDNFPTFALDGESAHQK